MKTVLVIDESRAHVAAAKDILENDRPRRFRVVHCNTCDAGFITAVREQPDMILLDQFSPQMIGLELLERLMRDPRTADIPADPVAILAAQYQAVAKNIPVAILAAQYQAVAKIRAFWRGAREYLVKPVEAAELLYVVNFMTEDTLREAPVIA